MTMLRAAIIGGGWIAHRHVPVLDAAAGVELVAACDTVIARAEAIAAPRGGHAYERWEDMLERERLDVLWVCTPPLLHRSPAVEALRRGIHVYLEKPLARTVQDGRAIVEAAASSAAICAIAYQWHALDLLDELRSRVAGQAIGLLVGRNYGPTAGRPWFVDRRQGGGQIFERASHHIDLQRAVAGEVAEVRAVRGSVVLAAGGASQGIEHVGSLLLHFRSGALGAIHMAWTHDGQPETYAVDVVASDATLALELGPESFSLRGRAAGAAVDIRSGDPFTVSARRFLEAVEQSEPQLVACTPSDALATLEVAAACERALADGVAVAVGSWTG